MVRVQKTGETIRRRLADPDCPLDFPFLAEMREEAVTDYLAMPLRFTNGEIHSASFTTRAPGGFTAIDEIGAIGGDRPPPARVAEVRGLRRTAINLLNAYVGRDAGERILAGRIRRGDSETIRAVIWLSDMRGFTRRADTMAPASLIELLNLFFDNLVPAIEAEGGEVLGFMGDGLLAIFRIADDGEIDPVRARAPAGGTRQAEANIAALRAAEGEQDLRFRACASTSARRSTAISALARGSISPASAPRSTWRRDSKKSPRSSRRPSSAPPPSSGSRPRISSLWETSNSRVSGTP